MSDSTNPIVLGQGLVAKVLPGQLKLLQSFLPIDGWLVAKIDAKGPEPFFLAGDGALGLARHVAQLLDHTWERSEVERLSWRSLATEKGLLKDIAGAAEAPASMFQFVLNGSTTGSDEFVILGASTSGSHPDQALQAVKQQVDLCLDSIANILSLIRRLDSMQEALADARKDACIDSLTKVLNRSGWNDYLRAGEDDANTAIAFVDVDLLKYVNDTQGHLAGDKLLRQTAQVLKEMLQPGDCVARLGGDEFAIALRNFQLDGAEAFRNRLKSLLDEKDIQVSFGLAFRFETDSISKTMRLADTRMYEEKRLKKQALS